MVNSEYLRADYIFHHLLQILPTHVGMWLGATTILVKNSILVVSLLLLLWIIRKIYIIFVNLTQKQVFLELIPPVSVRKTSYTTQQLFALIHNLGEQKTLIDKILGKKIVFSFEIVSTRKEGIRYLVKTIPEEVPILKRHILSYLPQVKVNVITESLQKNFNKKNVSKIVELKLKRPFYFPLQKQEFLEEHDPVAYITGIMTQLAEDEMVLFQIVLSSVKKKESTTFSPMSDATLLEYIHQPYIPFIFQPFFLSIQLFIKSIALIIKQVPWAITEIVHGTNREYVAYEQYKLRTQASLSLSKQIKLLNSFEQDLVNSIREKINQPLFEVSLRLFVSIQHKSGLKERIQGFNSSLAPFATSSSQGYVQKVRLLYRIWHPLYFFTFKKRLLSLLENKGSVILSLSEVTDLYHFPFNQVTQTEDMVKSYSKQLPAPLSLKSTSKLDVIFAKNNFNGIVTPIGLTQEQRKRHMYILGQTGSGKSTLLLSMIVEDIKQGKGLCVIDPHGQLIKNILPLIPENREEDIIYFNPSDIGYPIGLNLLELSDDVYGDALELEKELIAESIISLFHKLYSDKFSGPRMEYILRNTIHTAFTIKEQTLFTVYKLLINPTYRANVVNDLEDENLKDFWKHEFGKAGDYQKVKMISPITNKIGRFLFSPTSKRILEQPKSTINFDQIMSKGKILLCNLSKGEIGEDNSEVLGILIMTKIQLAALRRAKIAEKDRRDFYLYVDEFQNFATKAFGEMLSESRKYALNVTLAQQTTSQLYETNLVNIILANVGTVVCFRTANPEDEQLILPQFKPYVQEREILNLPWFNFYIRISTKQSQQAFSGETIYIEVSKEEKKVERIIALSRQKYASKYIKNIVKQQKKLSVKTEDRAIDAKDKSSENSTYFP